MGGEKVYRAFVFAEYSGIMEESRSVIVCGFSRPGRWEDSRFHPRRFAALLIL
jgi:hypothetical protein